MLENANLLIAAESRSMAVQVMGMEEGRAGEKDYKAAHEDFGEVMGQLSGDMNIVIILITVINIYQNILNTCNLFYVDDAPIKCYETKMRKHM